MTDAIGNDSDQWSCPSCTLMNALTAETCEACGLTSPLVLESYEAEERAAAMSTTAGGTKSPNGAARGRGSSQESMLSDAMSDDLAAEMDPWTQAEVEWAHVESRQETTTPKKRK